MPSNHLILCRPFFSCPQSFPASGLFQRDNSSHQVAKELKLQFSINPCNEYSGLISFKIDWFDLLAVQGTLKSLLQHHSLKASNIYIYISKNIRSDQFSCSIVSDFATPWTAAHQAFLSITKFRSLLKLMSFKSVMPSNHLILCFPLLLLPSIFPSIRVFFQ